MDAQVNKEVETSTSRPRHVLQRQSQRARGGWREASGWPEDGGSGIDEELTYERQPPRESTREQCFRWREQHGRRLEVGTRLTFLRNRKKLVILGSPE